MMQLLTPGVLIFSLLFPVFSMAGETLDRGQHAAIIKKLKQPAASGFYIRIITDEKFEVPDPSRPVKVELPNGEQKYALGFSGQNFMLVDNLRDLTQGGLKQVHKVQLTNSYGFPYGGEIDPATGHPIGYVFDSSTWDFSLFQHTTSKGPVPLKALAGAMGNSDDGKPFLIRDGHNNTRQRLFFDAEFRASSLIPGHFDLHAFNPQSVLNAAVPLDGNWIEKDAEGKVIFSHGYGGEPIKLLNGDLFVDERGWVPFVYETVVEQRDEPDAHAPGGIRKIPYRTAIVVAYLDKSLTKVMEPAKIIFDVFKPDGSVWQACQRPTAGPLMEGAHVEVRYQGQPVASNAHLQKLFKQGAKLEYQLLFSAGEYFGHYGSYLAFSKQGLDAFRPVLDDSGELLDITAPLRVLFTWIGRPMSFYADGKEYLMIHGVDRSALPRGITLDQIPQHHEWQYFKRQEIVVPVERYQRDGMPAMRMKDDSGLIEFLKKYKPRKVSHMSLVWVMEEAV